MAVDGAHIYWSEGNSIGRANLDGSGVNEHFITGANGAGGVVLDGSHVYWTNAGTSTLPERIGRANLDGSGANQSLITRGTPTAGLAVDARHIYWPELPGTIARANLDGSGVKYSFISAQGSYPTAVAVDGLSLAPVLGRSVSVSVVSGRVRVRLRGSRRFFDLVGDRTIAFGSTVDTTAGRVRLTTAVSGGGQQTADFYAGLFVPNQARTGLTTLALPFAQGCGRSAGVRAARRRTHRLWGNGHGRFRTSGQYAAATVRGTVWLTTDRCDGTLVQVTRGVVAVRDFRTRRTVTVRAGHHYLAHAAKT